MGYHLQKWAALFFPEEGHRAPTKPSACEGREGAFASMHFSTSRIVVAAAGSHRGFSKVIQEKGDQAEAVVNKMGVPTEVIRALAPHLENLIYRLGRLSHRLHDRVKLRDFIPMYFAPALGLRNS